MGVFILGLGAQKAGTTWLHRHLLQSQAFARGAMKEYHVWNSIYRVDSDGPPPFEGSDAGGHELLRSEFASNPDRYFEHFAELLQPPGKTTAADITPAYSGLGAKALGRIRTGFEDRGIGVKAVFLMRDPVERCWSAARMYRRKCQHVAGLNPSMPEAEFVEAYAPTDHATRRGSYEITIANIEQAFPRKSVFYGFFETLFEPETLRALCDFLEIEPLPGFAECKFNVSAKDGELPLRVRSQVARIYRKSLDFCGERFPATRKLWSSYGYL